MQKSKYWDIIDSGEFIQTIIFPLIRTARSKWQYLALDLFESLDQVHQVLFSSFFACKEHPLG